MAHLGILVCRPSRALQYYHRALLLARNEQNKGWEGYVLLGLGQVEDSQNEKPKALELYNQALALWRAVNNSEGEGLAHHAIGKTYLSQGDTQKALAEFNQALALFQSAKNKIQESLIWRRKSLQWLTRRAGQGRRP